MISPASEARNFINLSHEMFVFLPPPQIRPKTTPNADGNNTTMKASNSSRRSEGRLPQALALTDVMSLCSGFPQINLQPTSPGRFNEMSARSQRLHLIQVIQTVLELIEDGVENELI